MQGLEQITRAFVNDLAVLVRDRVREEALAKLKEEKGKRSKPAKIQRVIRIQADGPAGVFKAVLPGGKCFQAKRRRDLVRTLRRHGYAATA